jgi:hypothetical protein
MHRRRVFLSLSIAAVIAGGGGALPTSQATADSVESLASKVMGKLVAGDAIATVARIHEPRAWDVARASSDRHKVSEDLGVLLKEFGKISAPRVAGAVTFYELQVAGADVPYWRSLPNAGIDSRITYRANFSRVGPGIVALAFTRASGYWELRSVSLGLDRNSPESKEAMMRIGRVFLGAIAPRMSKDEVESALAQIVGQQPI